MKAIAIFGTSLLVAMLTLPGAASAVVLTFDDLPDPGHNSLVPDGYGGFDWNNFYYTVGDREYPGSGYGLGTVSQPHVAFNGFAETAATLDGPFDFIGCYLTGAWNDGLNVKVDGYLGGSLMYSQTVVTSAYAPTWFAFNYANVDELRFSSWGGVQVHMSGGGEHFAMDDFTYVPEPATLALVGLGLAGLVARRKGSRK